MRSRKPGVTQLRIFLFLFAALLHGLFIYFAVFQVERTPPETEAQANVIRLVDVLEETPPPPPEPPKEVPPEVLTNTTEAVAETMIETEEEPPEVVVSEPLPAREELIEYIPMGRVTDLPKLPEDIIKKAVVYPPIARRSGIEGSVYLELFVDRFGNIRNIAVLRENPEGRGFGEAALAAFNGIKANEPAKVNGEAVAVRYRYPVVFRLR